MEPVRNINKPSPVVSRRRALTLAGAALLGTTAARAQQGQVVLVGSGEHTYQCFHDWLTPPSDHLWGDTHGVAQDSKGRIYIAHTVHPESPKKDAILVFDSRGRFLTSWGERFAGGAHGLDLRREGNSEYLYHCDTRNRLVVKTTLEGKVLWEKGVPAEPGVYRDNAPYIPTNIAFAPNGDFYVADGYGSNWIHQYSRKGEWIRTFGGSGDGAGKLLQPHGLWLDDRRTLTHGSEPLLVVADRGNARLQYFTLEGKPMGFVRAGMRRPCHFHLRENLMLIPDLQSVVTLLDENNKVVAHLGDGDPSALRGKPRSEFLPGKFIHPHSARFLQDGSILVVEWVPIGRVTLLRKAQAAIRG